MGVAASDLSDIVIDSGSLVSLLLVQFTSEFSDPRRVGSLLSRSRVHPYLAEDSMRRRAALENTKKDP